MSGSWLEDALKTIYAENTVKNIILGHAYSRAVRAHFIVHASLPNRIMETIKFSDSERHELDYILMDSDRTIIFAASKSEFINKIIQKFEAALNETERSGPTAKL